MAKKEYVKNKRGETIYPVTKEDLVFDDNNVALNEKLTELSQTANSAYQKPVSGIPASDIASGVIPDVSNFITASVNNLINYYLKSETYTKAEVNALIGSIQRFSYESVESLPTASANTMGIIYLVPSEDPQTKNVKDEYITLRSGEVGSYTYSWEQIGSTAIDLSGYVTTEALNTELAKYTTTANLTTLLATKQDTISDLATIRSGAAAGATAYQKPQSGIPSTDMTSGVQTSLGKADSAYQKPSGGIPKTDLDSGVQGSLDLADSAIQSEPIGSIVPPVNPSEFATKEEVNQLGQEVGNSTPESETIALSAGWTANRYINVSNGNQSTLNGSSASFVVPLPEGSEGQTMTYTRCVVTDSATSRGICFYDSTRTFISGSGIRAITNGAQEGYQVDTCVVPAGAKFVRFTLPTANVSNFAASVPAVTNVYTDGLGKQVQKNTADLERTIWKDDLNLTHDWENGWVRASNGELVSSTSGPKRMKIENIGYSSIITKLGNNDENGAAVAFYNGTPSTSTCISTVALMGGIHYYDVPVPAGCKFIYLTDNANLLPLADTVEIGCRIITTKVADVEDNMFANRAYANFNEFMLRYPLVDHLFVNTAGSPAALIPSQSVFDIALAASLGFKYIELNVQTTSDGKMICLHGVSGKFGKEVTDINGDFTYQDTLISSVTYQWVKDNIRYTSSSPKYRTQLPELETLLKEAKRHNMSVLLTYTTAAAALATKYFGNNWIANFSTGTPSRPKGFIGPVACYSGLTAKADIIAQAKKVGVPYVHSFNPTALSSLISAGTLGEVIGSLHEIGALSCIAGIYQTMPQILDFYRAGGDISASGYELPVFYDGDSVIRSASDWSNFSKGGGTVSNGILTVPSDGLVYPTTATPTQSFGKALMRIRFKGTIHINSWVSSLVTGNLLADYTSDGNEDIIITTYNIAHNTTPYIKAVGSVEFYSIELIASELFV